MNTKKHNARAPPSPSQLPKYDVDDQSPTITKEVRDTMIEFYDENYKKALNLAKATVSHHPNSALALGALSCCHLKLGFIARKDSTIPNLSQDRLHKLAETIEHFKNAIHLSKRAVQLCPGCLTFWYFHVSALFRLAEYDANAQLEAVIEACDASLAIEYPTVMEDSLDIYDEEDGSTESRIEDLRKNLRVFKIQSIYIIDAESLRNIKNEIQELQDRKEEIEQARYTVAARVKAYWKDSMSMELKKDLLRIGIEDLKLHLAKKESQAAVAVVMQAVEYVKAAKNWKYWTCCLCSERFFEVKLNADHMKSVHLGTLSDELRSVEPEIVLDSVHNVGESRKWRPVDVVAAKKMMEDLSRNKSEDEGLNESKIFVFQEDWPYCKDRGRADMINRIRARLHMFLELRCFVSSHFSRLMDLIMEILKKRIPEQLLEEHWMNQTLLSTCFLDIPELNLVFEFLDDLDNTCGLQSLCFSLAKDGVRGEPCFANHEKIVFNEDFSCVVLDKRMLRGELVVPNDGAAVTSSADEEIELNDDECKDDIVDWLLMGVTNIGEQLKQWTNLRETSRSQGKEFFKIYEAEFHRMQNICEKKIQYLRDIKVWQNLESLCVEEDKRREEISGYKSLSYEYLLLERHRHIQRTNGDIFELDIIWNILRKPVDNEIKLEIKKQIDEIVEKLYKFDAIIRTTTTAMQQTGKKIDMVTAYDYRSIMVPLLKSFMRAQMEDLANKDAEKKSKAAEAALLSELDLNDKKNSDKGGGNARQGQAKSKDEKKQKDHRKSEELKAAACSEEKQETLEQISFHAAHVGDDPPNPEIVGPVTTDELEQEERKLTPEEEKEQRMLEEHMEYQRQIENEAKQKRLAELNKAGSSAGNMEKMSLRRVNFDDFHWKYFYQAQGVKLDERVAPKRT